MTPASDCPACPACKLHCGTRAGGWVSVGVARDRGVEWLACAACGHVWHAEGEELAQAARADRAWLREQEAERARRATQGAGVRKFWRRMWQHPRTIGVRESESAIYAIGAALVVFFERLNALRGGT